MKRVYYLLLLAAITVTYFLSSTYVFVDKVDVGAKVRELERLDQSQLRTQMDMAAALTMRDYAIVGKGQLKMPGDFKRVDVKSASLVIVHGVDYGEMKEYLQREFAANSHKTYVITALALKRIALEQSGRLFDDYLRRYKKSGDIFVDRGEPFYYMDQIQFQVKENLEGIIIAFPPGYYFSKVKNYGLAHLIENDFSVRGFENPIRFLETINFPKPGNFSGTFEELIALARKEYHEKYLANIVNIDYENGLIVPKDLVPFLPPRKRDKKLPLFKVVKLSGNVYFSGLIRDEKE